MRIAMPRGDIRLVRFLINAQNGTAADVDFTEIYFTVKRTKDDRLYEFQKKFSTGGITKLGLGDYQIKIRPKDTQKMMVNTPRFPYYVFDIQVGYRDENDEYIKESFLGTFVLTPEITYAENE